MTGLELQQRRRATSRAGSPSACCAIRLHWQIRAISLVGVATMLLAGCHTESSDTQSSENTRVAKKTGVRTEQELGPVRVTVEVVPAPARLSDEPTLTVTVTAKPGVDVQLPPFGEAVGDFVILGFREPLVEVRGDREVIRQVYSLEPPRTGTLEIDPITVTFTDKESGSGQDTQSLETEALAVEIVSLVDAEAPSLDDLQGFAPPMELPRKILWWPWIMSSTLVLFSLAIGIFWFRRRRAHALRPSTLSPREVASLELQRIWQEQLHLRDIKRFYTELTGIVRRYIEGTVGVRAPEQTTEEFLREISNGHVFSADERRRLKDFLESSDLVKFAAHQPDRRDIDNAYQRARLFVGIDDEQTVRGQTEAVNRQVVAHD
ncbi:MAG TPA: hypothetical protein QF564_24700 [Pirellulaceae bacterium]|nr:hypothetical protein [Pirellulaceae bacterium]